MKPLRLVLTAEQSATVRESGITFAVLANGSYPDSAQRSVLYLFACTKDQAKNACDVAQGIARAAPVKPSPTPP